ncbi:MAG: hypothetical protein PUB37_02980 [Firmicutes bacterium]|nr:hypothetical protein [Bacillota bacterium]
MTVWQRIYSALKDAGLRVYPAGAYSGACKEPYCVVQQAGTYSAGADSFGRTGYTIYYIHAYVPLSSYTALPELILSIRGVLTALEQERIVYFTGFESIHQIDDRFAAHTAYLEYRAFSSNVE